MISCTVAEILNGEVEERMPKIAIVTGSTRPMRNNEAIARWVLKHAVNRQDASFELVDIADHRLPFLDEPIPAIAGAGTRFWVCQNRPRVECGISAMWPRASVFLWDEVSYYSNSESWTRNRVAAGVRMQIDAGWTLDPYYLHQYYLHSQPGHIHVIGFTAAVRFLRDFVSWDVDKRIAAAFGPNRVGHYLVLCSYALRWCVSLQLYSSSVQRITGEDVSNSFCHASRHRQLEALGELPLGYGQSAGGDVFAREISRRGRSQPGIPRSNHWSNRPGQLSRAPLCQGLAYLVSFGPER